MNMDKELLEDAIEAINKNEGLIHEASHYTNVGAFVNMVQTIHNIDSKPFFRFWFTDAYCTNDKTEASLGYDFMINAFSAIESCLYSKEDRFLITNYESELKKSKKYKHFTPDKIRSLLTHEEATPYIMSLTRKTDDIDTWLKVYGDGGKGICMVFDFSDMDKYRYQSDFCIHGLFSVIYGNCIGYIHEKNLLQGIIWDEYIRFLKDVYRLNDFEAILNRKIVAMDQVCSLISSFIKGEEWHDECEERMAALRHFIPYKYTPKPVIQNKGKSHIEVDIPVSCLNKIIIGPCADKENIKKVIEMSELAGLSHNNVTISKKPLK